DPIRRRRRERWFERRRSYEEVRIAKAEQHAAVVAPELEGIVGVVKPRGVDVGEEPSDRVMGVDALAAAAVVEPIDMLGASVGRRRRLVAIVDAIVDVERAA